MTWSLPFLALGVLGFFAWESRNIFSRGEVAINTFVVRQSERPALFWFIATVNGVAVLALAGLIALWVLDVNGLRSG